jgi:EmrB/QacA subfamily drug resistance transporter
MTPEPDPPALRTDTDHAVPNSGAAHREMPATGGGPAPRRLMIFLVVALGLLMASIDQTIVATGLDTLQRDLHASVTWAGWTITIYAVGVILTLPVAGTLTVRYGHRRVFLASVVLFTGASLCCGLAGNIYLLVGLRAVQAIGGAGFTPASTGIIVEHFGSGRDKALGLFGSILPIGAVIGPVLGGVLIAAWSWRGIFLVNVPIGLVLIPLCLAYVPRAATGRSRPAGRLDGTGIALLGIGVLAGMAGTVRLGEPGQHVSSASFLVLEAAAALALGLLARHIRRSPHPLIPPRLIAGKGFGPVNLINFLFGVAVAGLGALIPLYAADRYGLGAFDAGSLLAGRGVAVIALSGLAVMFLRRTGYRWPLLVGCVLIAAGTLGLAASPAGLPAYAWLAATAALTGLGAGWSNPASRNASLQLAPDQSAPIAALRRMSRQLGSITSISVTTAILAQSSHPGQTMACIFAVFALILLAVTPLITRVPEHHGAW